MLTDPNARARSIERISAPLPPRVSLPRRLRARARPSDESGRGRSWRFDFDMNYNPPHSSRLRAPPRAFARTRARLAARTASMATVGLRAGALRVSRDASVCIDHWALGASTDVRAYFCTHAHADHVVGLERRDWAPAVVGGKIYCTATTREVLVRRWPKLGRFARALTLDEPHAIHLTTTTTITVTLIDAGHCPGSAMVLIEGECGRVLHTGDFRREDLRTRGALPACVTRAPIDALMLDNTYAHPRCVFVDRATATEEVVRLCREHRDRPIVLGVDALGKEDLVVAVSAAMGYPVEVSDDRILPSEYAKYVAGTNACESERLIRRSRNVKLEESARTNIRCVPKQQVRPSTLRALCAGLRNEDAPPLAILPTGWSAVRDRTETTTSTAGAKPDGIEAMTERGIDAGALSDESGHIVAVAYSLHAPYNELEAFVRAVRPGVVIGNTRVNADAEESHDPAIHFADLCTGEVSDRAMAMAEFERGHVPEIEQDGVVDRILKVRLDVNNVKVVTPKLREKPTVRLAAAENGVVFEPPRRLSRRERRRQQKNEWDLGSKLVLDMITAFSTRDENVSTPPPKKQRNFAPSFMM